MHKHSLSLEFHYKVRSQFMVYSFTSKADDIWKFQKSLALQFWVGSNFKLKMKPGDVNLSS